MKVLQHARWKVGMPYLLSLHVARSLASYIVQSSLLIYTIISLDSECLMFYLAMARHRNLIALGYVSPVQHVHWPQSKLHFYNAGNYNISLVRVGTMGTE